MDNDQQGVVHVGKIQVSPLVHGLGLVTIWTILRYLLFGVLGNQLFGLSHDNMRILPTVEFTLFLLLVFFIGSLGIVYLGLIKLGHVSLKRLGWTSHRLGQSVALGLIGTLVGMAALGWLYQTGEFTDIQISLTPAFDVRKVLLAALMGFAIAAWIEQSLLPGYIQPMLIEKWGYWPGIIVQAALWPAFHIGWFTTWQDFLSGFVFGLIFGLLRGRDRSLVAGALMHGLNWVLIGIVA